MAGWYVYYSLLRTKHINNILIAYIETLNHLQC